MSAPRSFHEAVDRFRHAITPKPVEDDVEMGDYDDQIGDELADREDKPGPEGAVSADMPEIRDGLIIRPGDTLIVGVAHGVTHQQAADYRALILARLPDLADVVVLAADQIAVYRPLSDLDVAQADEFNASQDSR